jgi:L-fucose mutarotase
MLRGQLIHPNILAALGRAGHSAKVLISDGNYPHWTKKGPNAEVVYLNLSPGMVSVTDALKALVSAVMIEKAEVMEPMKTGPFALKEDPPIWNEFRQILHEANFDIDLDKVERFKFYEVAGTPDVCLTIATGEQRIYANLLLTISVVQKK